MSDELKRRVQGMVARATVSSIEEKEIQLSSLNFALDDDIDGVERVQNYGLNSYPDDGAQGVVLFAGGNREHGLVISADFPLERLPLEKGEVALYSKFNNYVHLKANGSIEVKATKLKILNDSDDLISLIVDLLTALTAVTVNTAVGPQPFVNLADFTQLMSKFSAFKG